MQGSNARTGGVLQRFHHSPRLEFGPYAPTAGRTQHNQPPPELDRFLVSVMLLAVCLPHQPTWLQRMLLLISRKHSCELGTGGCGLEKLDEDISRDVCTPDRRVWPAAAAHSGPTEDACWAAQRRLATVMC